MPDPKVFEYPSGIQRYILSHQNHRPEAEIHKYFKVLLYSVPEQRCKLSCLIVSGSDKQNITGAILYFCANITTWLIQSTENTWEYKSEPESTFICQTVYLYCLALYFDWCYGNSSLLIILLYNTLRQHPHVRQEQSLDYSFLSVWCCGLRSLTRGGDRERHLSWVTMSPERMHWDKLSLDCHSRL